MTPNERSISAKPLKLSKHIFRGTLGVVRAPAPLETSLFRQFLLVFFANFLRECIWRQNFFRKKSLLIMMQNEYHSV